MSRPARFLLVAVTAAATFACGSQSSGTAPSATPSAPPTAVGQKAPALLSGLLAAGNNRVDFLKLGQSGSAITGTRKYLEYVPSSPTHVSQGADPVSGSIQGGTVQLTISGVTEKGTVNSDGSLTIPVHQADGTVVVEHFLGATVGDYDLAIAPLQALVAEWSTAYWIQQAQASCILTVGAVGTHDVRIYVAAGGKQTCEAANLLGYTQTTTYLAGATVLCVGTGASGGVPVAVADNPGQAVTSNICAEVNAGTFPAARAPA